MFCIQQFYVSASKDLLCVCSTESCLLLRNQNGCPSNCQIGRRSTRHRRRHHQRLLQEGSRPYYMDLQYGNESDFTTGKQVLPSGVTVEMLEKAIADESTEVIYKNVFKTILDVYKSGDLTPRTENDGTGWDPKFKPVLVVVRPNK
ncbi:hypothetical protein JYU34_014595 [Plutella xylostella]|uniref:Uncharacterized protein n=1 Tax=Plutella xylostella TaxID=51655 RepID=A0ABQ7Q8P9_PLUXY|nr:hypothetical protein JYU34_022630 [Plutella xylostella]KAG7301618.1 hypothetical protein JYU34_014595 [Plutella xylostella]